LRPLTPFAGYLVKQGGRTKSWKERFCVLDKQHVLSYYNDESCKQANGFVNLAEATGVLRVRILACLVLSCFVLFVGWSGMCMCVCVCVCVCVTNDGVVLHIVHVYVVVAAANVVVVVVIIIVVVQINLGFAHVCVWEVCIRLGALY